MRFLFSLVLLILLLAGGFVLAYRSGVIGGTEEGTVVVDVPPSTREGAEGKLEELIADRRAAHLSDIEVTSILHSRPELWSASGATPPVVTMSADTLRIQGTVATDRLPSDPALDAIRMLLPDTANVAISGTVEPFHDGTSVFHIATVEVEGMPVPSRYIPAILDRLGFPRRDDLGAEAIAIPLPAWIGSLDVADGELVLTP